MTTEGALEDPLPSRSMSDVSQQTLAQPSANDERPNPGQAGGDVEKRSMQGAAEGQLPPLAPPYKPVFIEILKACGGILVLVWILSSFLLGKISGQDHFGHRLQILSVDLDGGRIGSLLLSTTSALNGKPNQPTWVSVPFNSTPGLTLDDVFAQVRRGGKTWGAIVANRDASDTLHTALTNASSPAYNPRAAVTLIYNEARYRTVAMGLVLQSLEAAFQNTLATYQQTTGISNVESLPANATDTNMSALLLPLGCSILKIKRFDFAASFLLNSAMLVFLPLSQFFINMALNGILGGSGAISSWSVKSQIAVRWLFGLTFSCVIALSWAGWTFIWSADAHLFSSSRYPLIWLTVWLATFVNFNVIDFALSWLKPPFIPFFVFSWVMTQVSAGVSPVTLANQWYRVEYVLPSYHLWGALVTVLSDGADNHLKINLSVLFIWLVVSLGMSVVGNYFRWKRARSGAAEVMSSGQRRG